MTLAMSPPAITIPQPELATMLAELAEAIEDRAIELMAVDDEVTEAVAYKYARIEATLADPLSFALVYMLKHLKSADGILSIGQPHMKWVGLAETKLVKFKPCRDAFLAPRDCGKSTWWFLIIPMWAAAHGHSRFIAAFADSGTQAETHLMSFKHELDTNALLRMDFPELCTPMKRDSTGGSVADNRSLYIAQSGLAFKAAGIDASNLGLKVKESRPDFIIFDDIEPDESNYSAYQAKKRLSTVTDAVLPMNTQARVVFCGTVTMPGSIMHQLVNAVTTKGDPAAWITDEKITTHYSAPTYQDANGVERSCWPQKWSIEYLKSVSHTRSYAKNFKNQPLPGSGDYWNLQDFNFITQEEAAIEPLTHTLLSIDPAVTTKRTSDYTGLSVISYKPARHRIKPRDGRARAVLRSLGGVLPLGPCTLVWRALAVKRTSSGIRELCLQIIEEFADDDLLPDIQLIWVEVNQGGDLWKAALHDMPVPVEVVHNSVNKDVRAAQTLNHYQRQRVWHVGEMQEAEVQMMAYPNALNDDLVDSIGNGIARYAKRSNNKKPDTQQDSVSYL